MVEIMKTKRVIGMVIMIVIKFGKEIEIFFISANNWLVDAK